MGGSLLSDFHSVKCFIAWKFKLFKSISHSMGKCSKAHPMGENWNIDTHTFSQSMAILFREISTLWYSTSHEKCLGFINGKTQQNPSFNKNLGYRYPYFSCSTKFTSYVILHSMDDTCVFTWISCSIVKFSETPLSYGKYLVYWYPSFYQDIN